MSLRIAVVGGGVSGLTAAYVLSQRHEVTLYEASPRLGGHTRTVEVATADGVARIDMGFIVFNERNYPLFTRLLDRLGVASQPAEMSFSVRCEGTGLEYRSTSLGTIFAQRRNLLSPSFYRMLFDIVRFNRRAGALLDGVDDGAGPSLGAYVRAEGYSRRFWSHYLVPMASAIWSAPPGRLEGFPARHLVRFFARHGFLETRAAPRWRTIRNGAESYVRRIVLPFAERVRTGQPVRAVRRGADAVRVATDTDVVSYDHVVIAAHSDQALRLLADATPVERDLLGRIAYRANDTVLHTDARLLPRRRRTWASWNYRIPETARDDALVTYYSNRLQGLEADRDFCVSLNQTASIRPDRLVAREEFHHPVFTAEALAAQAEIGRTNGTNRTSFCGAYLGFGFHEDGVRSGLAAAARFGVGL